MREPERPNILFVMTDDMPEHLLYRMPEVDKRIVSEGIHFQNAYVSQSLCCPSRATILTGMYPHDTGVLSNGGPTVASKLSASRASSSAVWRIGLQGTDIGQAW
jgi:N-acetylglucosamine-6-sulfatase